MPLAEEASSAPADTGSEVSLLHAEFGDAVEFDLVDNAPEEHWWRHEGRFGIGPEALVRRAAELRRFLRDRPEKEIVLVAHGFFNHYLTGDVDDKGAQTTPWWREAELRTFEFVEEGSVGAVAWKDGPNKLDGKDIAMIRETKESLIRRKGVDEEEKGDFVIANLPAVRRTSLAASKEVISPQKTG